MLYGVSQSNDQLEPLELTPWRVLVIAAHPGDIEYVASPAVAKWTKEGAEVVYLVATRGELSIPGIEPEDAALIRSGEQSAAAAAVGVRVVDFLDIDDGAVESSVRLRRAIVKDIRRFRPDVVVIMNHREYEPDGSPNDPDHRATGISALDAITAAANQWAFRDVGEPHVVDTVLIAASPTPTHVIDVAGFEADAVAAFTAHEQHLAAVADHPMADSSWLLAALKSNGDRLPESTTAGFAVERIDFAQGRLCHSSIVKEFVDTDGRFQVAKLSAKSTLSKTPARARNATPSTPSPKKSGRNPKPRSTPVPTAPVVATGAMKLKVRLEQSGRSIGIAIPDSVMERLGGGPRPTVTVEINDSSFETTIGTSAGRRFVAINAERRKAGGIEVDDTFFVALSTLAAQAEVAAAETTIAPSDRGAEPTEPENAGGENAPKRKRRKRSSGSSRK